MLTGKTLLTASAVLSTSVCTAILEKERLELERPVETAFHTFMQTYGRSYENGSREYHERLALFAKWVSEVEAQNAKPERLWTADINALSDRTEAELSQLRGWRGVATRGASSTRRNGAFLSQRGNLPSECMNWTSLRAAKHVTDQGSCGSCWAVSSIKVLETHLEIHRPGSKRTFSAQELVSCVPNPHQCGGTGGCEGATMELAFHWAMNRGLAQEKDTPYKAITGRCKKSVSDPTVQLFEDDALEEITKPGVHLAQPGAPGLQFGMLGWERLPENGYEALLRATAEHGPVGVSVSARSWSLYSKGIFNGCEKDAVIDHAVVLIGFGKDKKTGVPFYLVQNSWGPGWGEHGKIRLLRSDNDGEHCGVDRQPEVGTGCAGGPKEVKVCGMCGILYDSTVPYFERAH
eukprot:CAMPEP_0171063522 /NCGR_PEP_ID=MMETSP0766_2-20121228/5710_1 /TAXON_ID=439317 /ORGANISM="Gambierdiscus australes, Strain CAWD 149" /LENGTH=405 /DNA_ID=CAMNT_0011519445 /DNA_START=78 /DNA_END=1295 /DNA_ORIENTATION=+